MKKKISFCLKFKVSIFIFSRLFFARIHTQKFIFGRYSVKEGAIKLFQGYQNFITVCFIKIAHHKLGIYISPLIFISITSYLNSERKFQFLQSISPIYKPTRVATLNILLRTYTIVRASLVIKIANKFFISLSSTHNSR